MAEHPGLASVGAAAFAYAAVLLDDDDNLTRLGNPTGEARTALRARIEELLLAGGRSLDDVSLEVDVPPDAAGPTDVPDDLAP